MTEIPERIEECPRSRFGERQRQNLSGDVGMLYRVLQMGHEHQISRIKPSVVQSVVVDLTQNGSRSANKAHKLSIWHPRVHCQVRQHRRNKHIYLILSVQSLA